MVKLADKDDIRQFMVWLFGLKLPKQPIFNSDAEKMAYLGEWIQILSKYNREAIAAVKPIIAKRAHLHPTIAAVLEYLESAEIDAGKFRPENPEVGRSITEWNGLPIWPPATIISREKAEKLGLTNLPRLNQDTGEITVNGTKEGNLENFCYSGEKYMKPEKIKRKD